MPWLYSYMLLVSLIFAGNCLKAAFRNIFKMSWNDYIDNLIAQSKGCSGKANIDKACIIGLENGNTWTTQETPHVLRLTPEEGRIIAQCFRKKDFTGFSRDVHVEDEGYIFIRDIDNKMVLARRGKGGITMQASKRAVVIAHTREGGQQGITNKAVAVIADYLESVNM